MSAAQDNAIAQTNLADAITAQANSKNTSVLHFSGYQAHNMAAAAWQALGTSTAKTMYHATQASNHLTTANQLKAAGK